MLDHSPFSNSPIASRHTSTGNESCEMNNSPRQGRCYAYRNRLHRVHRLGHQRVRRWRDARQCGEGARHGLRAVPRYDGLDAGREERQRRGGHCDERRGRAAKGRRESRGRSVLRYDAVPMGGRVARRGGKAAPEINRHAFRWLPRDVSEGAGPAHFSNTRGARMGEGRQAR